MPKMTDPAEVACPSRLTYRREGKVNLSVQATVETVTVLRLRTLGFPAEVSHTLREEPTSGSSLTSSTSPSAPEQGRSL